MKTVPRPVRFSSYGVTKAGNADADWEDAAAHSEGRGRFAVADGAAAAYRAGLWSHILACGFVSDIVPLDDDAQLGAWVQRRAGEWTAATSVGDDAPYYIRHAQRRGSFSTFLGVELRGGASYLAVAVGDTCLIHVRHGEIISSFPVGSPDDFGYQPDLLATTSSRPPKWSRSEGRLDDGDMLLGVTDAVSELLLRAATDGDPAPMAALRAADTSIASFVADARRSGRLRNDDVAVVRCLVGAGVQP